MPIETLIINSLLFLVFIGGGLYHLNIRRECLYPIQITKLMIAIILLLPLFFSFIAYISGNQWEYYVVALSGAFYFSCKLIGAGIHEKGIYYHGTGVGNIITQLAKWEDITDITFDDRNNQLKSFTHMKTRKPVGHPGKYENLDSYFKLEELLLNEETQRQQSYKN